MVHVRKLICNFDSVFRWDFTSENHPVPFVVQKCVSYQTPSCPRPRRPGWSRCGGRRRWRKANRACRWSRPAGKSAASTVKAAGWYSYSAYMSEYMNMAKARVVNLESVTHQLHFNDRRAFLNSAIRWQKLFGVNCKKNKKIKSAISVNVIISRGMQASPLPLKRIRLPRCNHINATYAFFECYLSQPGSHVRTCSQARCEHDFLSMF